MFAGEMVLHITQKTSYPQWSLEVGISWFGSLVIKRKMNGDMYQHNPAAIYQDAEDETRVDISARQ